MPSHSYDKTISYPPPPPNKPPNIPPPAPRTRMGILSYLRAAPARALPRPAPPRDFDWTQPVSPCRTDRSVRWADRLRIRMQLSARGLLILSKNRANYQSISHFANHFGQYSLVGKTSDKTLMIDYLRPIRCWQLFYRSTLMFTSVIVVI